MKLTLVSKHEEVPGVMSFIFEPLQPVTWIAGQYLTLVVPHDNPDESGTEHFFTIASAPFERHLQITTRLTGSSFKNTLNALPLGSQLEAHGIEGDFTLENPVGDYVFVIGGIGITPFRSILKQLAAEEKPISATLLYGNRSDQIVFKEELEALAATNPNMHLHYILSPEKLNAETIRKYVPDLSRPIFYISGPEPMVETFEEIFPQELGVPVERTKRDYFPGYTENTF